jgi:glucosamine--fructose-6-phosphate aminotransferase (isomerizing)
LRAALQADGCEFSSETDAEVVAHLIHKHFDDDLTEAVRAAYTELRGHYAIVAMHASVPGVIVGARKECPLIIGIGKDGTENFLASAIPAFMASTRRVLTIENGELVTLTGHDVRIETIEGEPVDRESELVEWDEEEAEKAGYDTFMMKEIHEQPEAIAETTFNACMTTGSISTSASYEYLTMSAHHHRRLRDQLPRRLIADTRASGRRCRWLNIA